MVTKELLDALRFKSEGTDLDFKREQYRFAGGTDHEKSEMLKDILAIANAWRDATGYIVLGFKDNRPNLAEVEGISENIDDSRLQQFVNSKVKPKLTFRYEEHIYEGKTVGVIAIPKQKRPFFVAHSYGKLKSNVAYVRRGSSTEEAEPTEVAAMALADAGRGQMLLDLNVLSLTNSPLPDRVSLKHLSFPPKLPDYASPPRQVGGFKMPGIDFHRDNRDFWREYADFAQIHAAAVEMKFVLGNRSETSLSNAKLEISVEALDGQSFRMLAGADLPEEPSSQWDPISSSHSLPEMLARREPRLIVDEDGAVPVCHVRFGSLLPGEEGRSQDTLVIVPSGPGMLRLRFRILAGELTTPQLKERMLETTGDIVHLDADGLGEMYGKALLAQYEAEQGGG